MEEGNGNNSELVGLCISFNKFITRKGKDRKLWFFLSSSVPKDWRRGESPSSTFFLVSRRFHGGRIVNATNQLFRGKRFI